MPDSSTSTPALNLSLPARVAGPGRYAPGRAVKRFVRAIGRLVGTLFTIGFSLLPLSAPDRSARGGAQRGRAQRHHPPRQVVVAADGPPRAALMAGLAVLVVLLAFAIEVVSHFPVSPGGQLRRHGEKVFGYSVADFVPNDPKLSEKPPLKGLFERRDKARKALVTEELDPKPSAHAAEVAAVNAELAAWADEPANQWMIPPELIESRRAATALRVSPDRRWDCRDRGENRRPRRGGHPRMAAGRGTPRPAQGDLQQAASRPNQGPIERADAAAKLAEVEREIAERTPNSLRLKLLLDSTLQPILGVPLWTLLPTTLVTSWPFVFLVMYGTDLLLLMRQGAAGLQLPLFVGPPRDTLHRAGFHGGGALVVILLAFVNGMYKLNESTGVPGNVLVMSEGSTDELFSNLERSGSGGVDNVMTKTVNSDQTGRPIAQVGVARGVIGPDGRVTRLPAERPRIIPARSTWRVSNRTSS